MSLKPTVSLYPTLATGLDPASPAYTPCAVVSDFNVFATPNETVTKYEHNATTREVKDFDPLVWDVNFETPVTVKVLAMMFTGLMGLPTTSEVEAAKCYSHLFTEAALTDRYLGAEARLLTGNGNSYHINKMLAETISLKADPQKTLIASFAGKGVYMAGGLNPGSYSLEAETAYIRANTNSTHTISYGATTITLPSTCFSADESFNVPLDMGMRYYGASGLGLPLHNAASMNVTTNFSLDASQGGLDTLSDDMKRIINLGAGGDGSATLPTSQNYDNETLVTYTRYFKGGLCGGSTTNYESVSISIQGYIRMNLEALSVGKIRRNLTGNIRYKQGTCSVTIQNPVTAYTVPSS